GLEIQKNEANNLLYQDVNARTKLYEDLNIKSKKLEEKTELYKNLKENRRLYVARANNASHNAADVHSLKIMEYFHCLLPTDISFNIFSDDNLFRDLNRGDHFGKRRVIQNPPPKKQNKINKTNNKKDVSMDQT
ncbi:unnamed protein product, partial [Lymnaea stagnalis]